jgi:DNA-binding response OmpR family regulator
MKNRCILIVDRQDYWREISADALSRAGYTVRVISRYDLSQSEDYFDGQPPDLVVLGCASIKREEREFIEKALADNRSLLVLSASLPWDEMRAVFLKGASDVANKTYDPENLVRIIDETFDNLCEK